MKKLKSFYANNRLVRKYVIWKYTVMISFAKKGLWETKEKNKSGIIDTATHSLSFVKLKRTYNDGSFYFMYRLIIGKMIVYIAELGNNI